MAEYTFYHNPMSRGWIASWALTEVGADYEIVLVDWGAKPQALLDANPMGKVPTLVHHHGDHDHVITEAAAICHYLATTHPDCGLLPDAHEAAAYYRWLFFAAGPVEAAVTARSMGWEVAEDKIGMAGFGTYDLVVDTLDEWLAGHDHVCGDRFTMADVYVGSQVDWGLRFGSLPERASFSAYQERMQDRKVYKQAGEMNVELHDEMSRDD
jgi:glutathione S-transferase